MRSLNDLTNMHGRCSLVTGAAGHLGMAIADALAEMGSELLLLDLDRERLAHQRQQLQSSHGVPVHVLCCDLENDNDIAQIPERINHAVGRLDVLINNAAFVGSSTLTGWAVPFDQQSVQTWRRALDVNLTAAFALVQACRPLLDASGNGSIVNIGSIYGFLGPDMSLYKGTSMQNPIAYAASKGGLLQMTRWLSTVLAPRIRVNAISPGGIARGQPDLFVERYVARTPLGRMASEEDFKGAIAYLASDLSQWVTGHNLVVDGGWSAW